MSPPPIPMRWTGENLTPVQGFVRVADEHYVIGDVYRVLTQDERSEVSHKHEFAWLREAWKSLPDALRMEYPSSEHLRKRGLIETGFCTMQDYVCGSKAEAKRWADNLRRELDEYALIVASETVVRVFRAKSQSRAAMGAADFQASKTALIEWVSALLETSPAIVARQREAA